jgi:hypothetical protein
MMKSKYLTLCVGTVFAVLVFKGQPVRLIKRIDRYAQKGWSSDVIPHLVEIDGDIYEKSIE